MIRAAETRLAEAAVGLTGQGIAINTFLLPGTPSQVILERADALSPLAIVLGTRGLTGLRHLLLGSTAQRVVHGARCPVLAVRKPA